MSAVKKAQRGCPGRQCSLDPLAGHGYRWTETAGTGQYGESIG